MLLLQYLIDVKCIYDCIFVVIMQFCQRAPGHHVSLGEQCIYFLVAYISFIKLIVRRRLRAQACDYKCDMLWV